MDNPVVHVTTVFMGFFAIVNPVTNAPLFLGVTTGMDEPTRRGVAVRAVALAFLIVATFAVLGRGIFSVFGITLPAFRIAGGLLIALVGYRLLEGRESGVHTPSAEDTAMSRDAAIGVAVSPLAMPILAGPGAIATAMGFTAGSSGAELAWVLVAFAAVCVLNLAAFLGSDDLVRYLGRNGIKVVSRLMGLILAVIGTQMVIVGVRGAMAGG
jgi:multiple antibiotic resistance protein